METDQKHIREVRERLDQLRALAPIRINFRDRSRTHKLPWKVESVQAALLMRTLEISEVSFNHLVDEKIVPGFILVRSAFETVAVHYWLYRKVSKSIADDDVKELNEGVLKAAIGTKDPKLKERFDWTVDAINVLTAFGALEKDFEKLREHYDHLSDFAHPNHLGVVAAYSADTTDGIGQEFRPNARGSAPSMGFTLLLLVLEISLHTLEELNELLDPLARLAERKLPRKPD